MKLKKQVMHFVAGFVLFGAVAPVALAADDAAAAIKAGSEAWIKAYNAGNVDAVAALYAEDAVVMPPGAPPLRGRTAIRQYLVKDIAESQAGGIKLVLSAASDVGMSGDLAWHSGTFSVTNKAGATVDTGKYMEVHRKVGGKWQLIRDIWNSDTPPAPPPPPAAPKAK